MKKVFDRWGDLTIRFAKSDKERIRRWLSENNTTETVAYLYSTEYNNDPVFGEAIEFPAKLAQS